MKKNTAFPRAAIIGLAAWMGLAIPGRMAHADILFQTPTDPYVILGQPGDTISFVAWLADTQNEGIVINDFDPGLAYAGFTVDNQFFFNVPDPLPTVADSYTLFQATIDTNMLAGDYQGIAVISYDTATQTGLTSSQAYTVHVAASQAVPEASTVSLLGASLVGCGVLYCRKSRGAARSQALG